MKRRKFLQSAALGSLTMTGISGVAAARAAFPEAKVSNRARFNLKYAPTFGDFINHAGEDLLDQIRFMHDQGFRAMFDNWLMRREPAIQEKIGNELDRLGMDLGPFIIYGEFQNPTMVNRDPEVMKMLRQTMLQGLEVQKRTNAKTALIVPGRYDQRLHRDYQTANFIDAMRMCSDVVGSSGLVLVIEPLNNLVNHPGLFLTTIPQAYMICKAVDHPSCRLINDIYHQQITEGNLIPNIDMAWDYIASFHVGDNPGRNEPGTGEINYRNVFRHIYNKGYDGVIGMEHGRSIPGIEGEKALIEAYRKADSFET
jgi:hydroxypyruvate isomerase